MVPHKFNNDWSRFIFILFWFSYSMSALNVNFSQTFFQMLINRIQNNTICTFPLREYHDQGDSSSECIVPGFQHQILTAHVHF